MNTQNLIEAKKVECMLMAEDWKQAFDKAEVLSERAERQMRITDTMDFYSAEQLTCDDFRRIAVMRQRKFAIQVVEKSLEAEEALDLLEDQCFETWGMYNKLINEL